MNVRLHIRRHIMRARSRPPVAHQRQIIVHHHINLRDINTTSDDVRRDEHFLLPVPETVDDSVSFDRVFRTMQRGDFVALGGHALRDSVGCVTALWVASGQRGLASGLDGDGDEEEGRKEERT